MDAARVQGTLWNVLYYIAGAVNRFLRAEPSGIIKDDPFQESTIESRSSANDHTAGFRQDKSAMAACPQNATGPAWAGEDAKNTETEAPEQFDNSAKESVEMTSSFAHLNLREKTTGNLENSGGPKTREKVENTDGFFKLASDRGIKRHTEDQLEVGSGPKRWEGEDHEKNSSADNQSKTQIQDQEKTTGNLENSAQELDGAFKNIPVSVCDVPRQLHAPACEEPLPEHNNEDFPDGNTTQGFLEGADSEEIQTHGRLQEEVENEEQESLQNGSRSEHDLFCVDEMKVMCESMKMRDKLSEQELDAPCGGLTENHIEDLQEGTAVVELRQGQKLHDAAGNNSEVEIETSGFTCDKLLDVNKERVADAVNMGGDLTGSSLDKEETAPEKSAVENARNGREDQDQKQEEEVTKDDETVKAVKDAFKDDATTVDLATSKTCDTKESTPCSVIQRQDVTAGILLDLGVQTASPEENFDAKQDEISYENLSLEKREPQIRSETESFIEISWDFLDQSFGESQAAPCTAELTAASASFAVEQANVQTVAETNAAASLKSDSQLHRSDSEMSREKLARCSGEALQTKIPQSSEPEGDIQVNSFALNFAPQRSRIAVKNPRARPPTDRHSLLMRPSVDAACPPPPPPPPPTSKNSADGHVFGGLGFGIKLPGLGSGFPVLKKLQKMEAEPKAAPKPDSAKQADVPQKPKWMPPKQAGFGNPFISELKTKLKKATKN
ncbi:uncharacterized protein si:ch211-136m16.8 [Syngnathoides biaculeatus]|uniref:uncharacterized protein si:ch211-136m16.8 n=1 Tax=Syngnathoides biaculeatus TaxID=300417 RepID=UPI002ADDFFA5|nr:uncharacterized protein si:ch211-136m16.8 [Syngnathoides biaculeatus]